MNDNTVYHTTLPSPVGPLTLRGTARGLTGIFMTEHRHGPTDRAGWTEDAGRFGQAIAELGEYFAGERTTFDLPVDEAGVGGTEFQRRVWRALRDIRHGQTISYGELARRIGQPAAVRAVGLANGRNPLSIVVPCHRVIGASGSLTGYGGGMARKRWLLAHEAALTPLTLA